jgi:hypothetical protein
VGEVGTSAGARQPLDLPHPGRVDVLVDCDDGTTGVVDFKTTIPKPDQVVTYSRQLHAHAVAREHPASGRPERVSSLGLLCFLPDGYEAAAGRADLRGGVEWIEVPRDDEGFVGFLGGDGCSERSGPSACHAGLWLVRASGRSRCGGLMSRVGAPLCEFLIGVRPLGGATASEKHDEK